MKLKKYRLIIIIIILSISVFETNLVSAEEVIPKSEEKIETAKPALYPFSIDESVTDENYKKITKTYALNENENPDHIDRSVFEKQGFKYILSDIIKTENRSEDSYEHVETVEINTSSSRADEILAKLDNQITYGKNGYEGILTLDTKTIKTEVAGRKTNNYQVTKTREYPNLPSSDTSLVPKSIVVDGKTYNVSNISFRAGSSAMIDYEEIPSSYTAVATYTSSASSTKITGYLTTAMYKGIVTKTTIDKTIYTAVFISAEKIEEDFKIIDLSDSEFNEEIPEEFHEKEKISSEINFDFSKPILLITLFVVFIASLGLAFLLFFFILRYNITIYNKDGDKYKKIAKMKLSLKKPELNLTKLSKKTKSNNFVIELSERATKQFYTKEITVIYKDNQIKQKIDNLYYRKFQFEVDFTLAESDDEEYIKEIHEMKE